MSLLDKKIEDYVSEKEDEKEIFFEYEDIYEYNFPYEDSVPEDYYYSKIVDIREYRDKYKNTYTIVYYIVFQTIMLDRWEGGYISDIPYHHICQKYEKHSIPYNKFCASMHKATKMQKFNAKSLIGTTEVIHMVYQKDGCIGSISERKPITIHPSWFDENH